MKKQIVGILTAAVLVFGASGCATHSRCTASEYKVVQTFDYRLEKQLNELSQQGWTVVSITTSQTAAGEGGASKVVVLLKRPKQ